ncbi:MAG: type II toxin-antitoxin system VapC family toxin [Phycisphaeraceae bacterium]|nr:type II toxin-antitoxin system VapC family toxin [Phycisphaeraceae bacterium]
MVVLDASIALAWVLPDEQSVLADAALRHTIEAGAIVPPLWSLEVANALLVAERRGRLSGEQAAAAVQLLAAVPIRVAAPSPEADFGRTVQLARIHALSAYDGRPTFGERTASPLATLDARLRDAARSAAIPIFAPDDSAADD